MDNVVWGITHITGPNVTSLVLPVSPDQLYFARVSAFNATGESTFAVAGPAHSRQNLSIRLTSGPRSYLTIPDTALAQSRTLAVGGASPQAIADTNGNLTCEAYIRLDNTGSATIYSTIRHRAWPFQDDVRKTLPIPPPGLPPNVPPSGDTWEWAYLNPLFSYWWFGVRNGRLVCEVQDGRVTGYITSGPNPGGPSDITLSPAGGSGCVVLDAGPLFGNVQPSAMFPPFSGTWHDCVSQWYIGIPPIFGIDPNVPPNCDFGFPALSAARDAQVGSYEIILPHGAARAVFLDRQSHRDDPFVRRTPGLSGPDDAVLLGLPGRLRDAVGAAARDLLRAEGDAHRAGDSRGQMDARGVALGDADDRAVDLPCRSRRRRSSCGSAARKWPRRPSP